MNLVSILVPIYNVEKYFQRCLTSLFEQNFQSIEYVFVNDCSQDNSMKILSKTITKYPKRIKDIKIINHPKNMGLAVARKTAIEHATSDYIIHVDSDDYIDSNMVRDLYNEAQRSNADVVLVNTSFEYSRHNRIVTVNYLNKGQYLQDMLTRKALFRIAGILIRREIITKNDIYPIPGINFGEDYQVTPRIIYYAENISKINAIYHYDQTNQSSYSNTLTHKGISDIIESQKILNNFFLEYNRVDVSVLKASTIMTIISLLSVSNVDEYNFIYSSFKRLDYGKMNISLWYKILLFLMRFRLYRLSYSFIMLYKYIFHQNRR